VRKFKVALSASGFGAAGGGKKKKKNKGGQDDSAPMDPAEAIRQAMVGLCTLNQVDP
jgi:hypothetical protein